MINRNLQVGGIAGVSRVETHTPGVLPRGVGQCDGVEKGRTFENNAL